MFLNHLPEHNISNSFTDGSKTQNGVGYAFINKDTIHGVKISSIASICTAELLAILAAIKQVISQNNSTITIITDSGSAIQGIHFF